MPVQPTYPGVYIEEVPSGVRTIVGVATSITAFVGRARRGPMNKPTEVSSFGDFERKFGALWAHSPMTYAVRHFFLNGGATALIVRVHNGGTKTTFNLPTMGSPGTDLVLEAASEGSWGNDLRVRVESVFNTDSPPTEVLFNLWIRDTGTGLEERYFNLSMDEEHKDYVKSVLEEESDYVRVQGNVPDDLPEEHIEADPGDDPFAEDAAAGYYALPAVDGSDGSQISDPQVVGNEAAKTGIYALMDADLFNLLCIPPYTLGENPTDVAPSTWSTAVQLCKKERAMLLVDPTASWDPLDDPKNALDEVVNERDENSAIFFPRLRMADPLKENRLGEFAPCGAVSGLFARTDAERGVWKAPAGIEASLVGVPELQVSLTDAENGRLNPLGINCFRAFPVFGRVSWGARTTMGADQQASEWKYIPVRRTALFIEESLYRGTQWVVFEPNDEKLWSQIRLNVGSFMQGLFRQGAFQGTKAKDAYLVKCDAENNPQAEIDKGIVNILVGFAPLKPAEFVIIKIQQLAGQVEA